MPTVEYSAAALPKAQVDDLNAAFGEVASIMLPLCENTGISPMDLWKFAAFSYRTGPLPLSQFMARHRARMASRIAIVNAQAAGRR